jgi:hypothetical protein
VPGFAAAPRRVSANEKLNIGAVGCGGKGASDIQFCSGENIVALCDVDARTLAARKEAHPKATTYQDWRVMLEKEKSLDAVIVSIPDHGHAMVPSTAMRLRKHVYCQKPLVQTVYEARLLRKLEKEHGVATQMGNQGAPRPGLRRAVEVVHAGLIGPVRQVHVWSNRPIWPQAGPSRRRRPVPENLNWDLWLGRQVRPFKRVAGEFEIEARTWRKILPRLRLARMAGLRRRARRHIITPPTCLPRPQARFSQRS